MCDDRWEKRIFVGVGLSRNRLEFEVVVSAGTAMSKGKIRISGNIARLFIVL